MTRLAGVIHVFLVVGLCQGVGVSGAQELAGQRVKVKGQWQGSRFEAARVKLKDPKPDKDRGRIVGPIDTIDLQRRRFRVGSIHVDWNDAR